MAVPVGVWLLRIGLGVQVEPPFMHAISVSMKVANSGCSTASSASSWSTFSTFLGFSQDCGINISRSQQFTIFPRNVVEIQRDRADSDTESARFQRILKLSTEIPMMFSRNLLEKTDQLNALSGDTTAGRSPNCTAPQAAPPARRNQRECSSTAASRPGGFLGSQKIHDYGNF